MSRMNPFGDLADFEPTAKPKPVATADLEQIARDTGFVSRQATPQAEAPPPRAPRRYVTGRNRQLNLKVTAETAERFYQLADARRVPLGELLELALAALEP